MDGSPRHGCLSWTASNISEDRSPGHVPGSLHRGVRIQQKAATSYRIEISDDELVWKRRRFDDKPLRHLIDDTFASDQTVFAFDRDADDRATGFTVHTMRAFGMRFERTE
ncbi:MAG: hypothetical protein R3A46_21480 [Thermomicrobiales bacterium]